MKLIEALLNAQQFVGECGDSCVGDTLDNLSLAILQLRNKYPQACEEEL